MSLTICRNATKALAARHEQLVQKATEGLPDLDSMTSMPVGALALASLCCHSGKASQVPYKRPSGGCYFFCLGTSSSPAVVLRCEGGEELRNTEAAFRGLMVASPDSFSLLSWPGLLVFLDRQPVRLSFEKQKVLGGVLKCGEELTWQRRGKGKFQVGKYPRQKQHESL